MRNKTRVLLIYPNERQMSTIPPAITLLSQLLKNKDHKTDIFDTTFYEFDDDVSLDYDDEKNQEKSFNVDQ